MQMSWILTLGLLSADEENQIRRPLSRWPAKNVSKKTERPRVYGVSPPVGLTAGFAVATITITESRRNR